MTDDLPYKTWDDSPGCPHCGSDFVEITESYDADLDAFSISAECFDCGRKSLEEIDYDEIE